ncbi:MAG: glycosyltransferase [Allosphingosinicella sp.]
MSSSPRPSISVAMATWNGALYLPEQLESLARQTLPPTELVVVDDSSSDSTIAVLEAFAETAPFDVRIVRNAENMGVMRTFERAISLCRGDYVFLCDQDDYWDPAKIATVVAEFGREPRTMVIFNDKIIADENLKPSSATVLTNMRNVGTPDIAFIAGCCMACRREWFDVALPVPVQIPFHDWWLAVLAHQLRVSKVLDRPLQLYRRHGTNASAHPAYSDRPLGRWDRLRSELKARFRGDRETVKRFWTKDIDEHEALAARIGERRETLAAMGLGAEADSTLHRLALRIATARGRLDAATAPLLPRVRTVWRLWRSGGYAPFSGWKSAVKDLLQ